MNITKHTLAALAAAALLAATPSCKDESENPRPDHVTPDNYEVENEAAISKAKIASKVAPDDESMYGKTWGDEYSNFVGKVNHFSNKVATSIGCKGDKNIAVSPVSIFMGLGMATECASGETRQELLDVLGVSYEELSSNIQALNYDCNQALGYHVSENQVKCVNSLWLREGFDVKDSGIKSLTTNYFSDLFTLDFTTNVNSVITSYIKNETNGLLSPNLEVSDDMAMVLLNVVYLRDIWNEFNEDLEFTSEKYDFKNFNNSKTSIKLLQGYYNSGRALRTELFRKFVTYTENGIGLTFYVPTDGHTVEDIYTPEVLDNPTPYVYTDDANRYHTRCLFPEFKATFDNDIKKTLKDLGVKKLFDANSCDFSNITNHSVYCGKVKHVTNLEVTKSGIEGAAITEFEMLCGAPGPGENVLKDVYEDFVVDRDFVYILTRNGIPLFTGVVKSIK